ncbi:MAG: hypothetical protein M1828_007253 [Chrysothrix sp. TS-e1954]|nr:MAG: hypothetical protein M1828_007253 [Chrysothrix sp. TS-e1954]
MATGGGQPPMVSEDAVRLYATESYWAQSELSGVMYAHIALSLIAWVIILPIAVMLSVARSRLGLIAQLAFLVVNGFGVLVSVVYNSKTPDLYEHNSHHKAGWAMTWLTCLWTVWSAFNIHHKAKHWSTPSEPVSSEAFKHHPLLHESSPHATPRWSGDSGQGTERNTASLLSSRTNSWDSSQSRLNKRLLGEVDDELCDVEKGGLISGNLVHRVFARPFAQSALRHSLFLLDLVVALLERLLLPLGFVAIVTGAATYGGIARGHHLLNVLAHFIKGGIFFWYGLLTFGRWLGCFADFGWAWNIKPGAEVVGRRRSRMPTAEFTESFVIWFYGASNVFLEHLTAWGGAWSPMDLEHVSITIMFFGGGMLGMLIESTTIRNLLTRVVTSSMQPHHESKSPQWQQPDYYKHAMNPIPALIIMLLGILMSSHAQNSMVSSAIHKQWGTLFSCFALARGVTYITMWIKPPQTYLPSRPPSELVAAFCLVSGGLIFMASNTDTVHSLETHGLMANFIFTTVMSLTSLLMAWMTVVVAIKAWASERTWRTRQYSSNSTFAA